jgi:hypothetical protein
MFRTSCSDLDDLRIARMATLLVAAACVLSVLAFAALAVSFAR